MRVGDEHEIDGWKLVQVETRMANPLNHLQPLGPVGIDKEAVSVDLDEKGRVANPGDPHFIGLQLGENGRVPLSGALGKKGGNQHLREKVPSMPPIPGL